VPDPVCNEAVVACVVLKQGCEASDELDREIREFCKARLESHRCPRRVEFMRDLPLTSNGKPRRAELRVRLKKAGSAFDVGERSQADAWRNL